jgi:hypothetical protein
MAIGLDGPPMMSWSKCCTGEPPPLGLVTRTTQESCVVEGGKIQKFAERTPSPSVSAVPHCPSAVGRIVG